MLIKFDENGIIRKAFIGCVPSITEGFVDVQDKELHVLFDIDGIALCRWDGENVIPRTPKEIEADRANLPKPEPTTEERLGTLEDKANRWESAYMQGVNEA